MLQFFIAAFILFYFTCVDSFIENGQFTFFASAVQFDNA